MPLWAGLLVGFVTGGCCLFLTVVVVVFVTFARDWHL